ncbi:MAG: 2'-5' RNA ligase family protein [Lachnospiraceae bacterium]|nr:2'-5' RNA ligase family protein [Lachnospiraceae bacterium]
MYQISIYFNKIANSMITYYINHVAVVSGNSFMIDNQVPPHITLSSFNTKDEAAVISALEEASKNWQQGKIKYVTTGTFFPFVLYIAPVLNEYLHGLSVDIYNALEPIEGIEIYKYYKPFQWIPHTTIGKTLSQEEMQKAFRLMQTDFNVFDAKVVKIGLAKTNPYRDIWEYELNL